MEKHPIKYSFDCNPDEDDTAIFYTRKFGNKQIVIIPKDRFSFAETESTFVLTLIED